MVRHDGIKCDAVNEGPEGAVFAEMCEICLWAPAADRSLLANRAHENTGASEARKAPQNNMLVNELPAAYRLLRKARDDGKEERRVDIVLGNAGFELYADLVLTAYLLSSGLATLVVLHPKSIPWCVSDAVPADFAALLNSLASPRQFYDTPSEADLLQHRTPEPLSDRDAGALSFLFQRLSQLYVAGQVIIRPHRFWTHPSGFWRLPRDDAILFGDLKASGLVIFKGDLNYRKLTCDVGNILTNPCLDAY